MIKNLFSFVEKFLSGSDRFYTVLTDKQLSGSQSLWGSRDNPLWDPNTMASPAGVITLNYPFTIVSGVGALTGITVPYPDFQGTVTIIPTGVLTWTAATNIQIAGTVTAGNQVPVSFTYNPTTGKWYPSRIT